jgi:hypothetical protein
MSWFERKIMTAQDLKNGTAVDLPSQLQVGQSAKLWVFDENKKPTAIPCTVAGVGIEGHHAVYYDLAFPIAGTDLFVKVDGFRGYVTDVNETEIDPEGGLVDVDEVKKALAERLMGQA